MKILAVLIVTLLWPFMSVAQSGDFAPGEIIVKFKSPKSDFRSLGKAAANAQLTHQKAWRSGNFHQFSMKTSDSVYDVLQRLKEDPEVEYAEPNYYLYSNQQAYSATSAAIGVVESWSVQSGNGGGEAPIIAILDSGVDINHRVFKNTGRLWTNPGELNHNGYDDDRNGYRDDIHGWNFIENNPNVDDPAQGTGHGTHVAGIAVGVSEEINNFKPNNAPPAKVQIMALKFLDAQGVGKTSNAIEAIYYAVDNGARVINNSWGGRNYSAALHEALTYAYNKGVIIVSAAGNNGTDNDLNPMYPASYDVPSMISVAAVDNYDRLAEFSNYGAETVHVTAPGVAIYSTVPTGTGREYYYKSGTSMAAPFIAGLAAMLIREAPGLTGYQIKEKILQSSPSVTRCTSLPVQFCVEDDRRMDAREAVVYAKSSNKEAPYQPYYSPSYKMGSRDLASSDLVAQGFGCGTVRQLYTDANSNLGQKNKPKHPSPLTLVLLAAPVLLALGFKYRYRQHDRRASERQRIFMRGQIVTDRGFVVPVQVLCWSAGGAGIQLADDDREAFKNSESFSNVTLRIKSKLGHIVVSSAKVVRKDQSGYMGIQFDSGAQVEDKKA